MFFRIGQNRAFQFLSMELKVNTCRQLFGPIQTFCQSSHLSHSKVYLTDLNKPKTTRTNRHLKPKKKKKNRRMLGNAVQKFYVLMTFKVLQARCYLRAWCNFLSIELKLNTCFDFECELFCQAADLIAFQKLHTNMLSWLQNFASFQKQDFLVPEWNSRVREPSPRIWIGEFF